MGIFYEQAVLVNRTSKPCEVVFDGQRIKIKPNYDAAGKRLKGVVNSVPTLCIPYALNQNALMGSEDAHDPSSFQSVIGVEDPLVEAGERTRKSWHECSFLEQDEAAPTRVKLEEYLDDPSMTVSVKGKVIPRAGDAALPGTSAPFDIR